MNTQTTNLQVVEVVASLAGLLVIFVLFTKEFTYSGATPFSYVLLGAGSLLSIHLGVFIKYGWSLSPN